MYIFTIWTLHLKDLVFLLDSPAEANLWHQCHRQGNVHRWLTQAMVHPNRCVRYCAEGCMMLGGDASVVRRAENRGWRHLLREAKSQKGL